MKIPGRVSSVVRAFATSGASAVGAIFFARPSTARSTAGDVSVQPCRFTQHNGFDRKGNAAAISGKRMAERRVCYRA